MWSVCSKMSHFFMEELKITKSEQISLFTDDALIYKNTKFNFNTSLENIFLYQYLKWWRRKMLKEVKQGFRIKNSSNKLFPENWKNWIKIDKLETANVWIAIWIFFLVYHIGTWNACVFVFLSPHLVELYKKFVMCW